MVDYDSRQYLWVHADDATFAGAFTANTYRDGSLGMHPDASSTKYHLGGHPAAPVHRHWTIEYISFKFWDDSTDEDNSATDWELAVFSATTRAENDIDSDTWLFSVPFANDDAGKITTGTNGNVTFYNWEDHDVNFPYIITDTPSSGYSTLYTSLRATANTGDTDTVTLLFGMRPLNFS